MSSQRVKVGRANDEVEDPENRKSRVIRAIQESKSAKLTSINSLLQTVVQSARAVVKGTDSQRRFNAQFSEFCRAALVGIADLEDALCELEKDEGVANGEVKGIRVADFIRELSGFVASQTTALGAQYLEHVGMSAVTTTTRTQQKSAENKWGTKRERTDDGRQRTTDRRGTLPKRTGTSPPLDPVSELEGRTPQKTTRVKAGANNNHSSTKLTSIPALTTWLQPWTLLAPSAHGVALDRVTTERPKPQNAVEEPIKSPNNVSVFEICTAPTTTEVLRLWEARESALSSGMDRSTSTSLFSNGVTLPLSQKEVQPMFFPRGQFNTCASVSTQLLGDLVHYGISVLEVPFKDMV
ncbi:uncharacterized protein TM35_000053970 [Trypanosoma theileri]|uniref:Uncharacterized protein n=1 Tax=Trypanosoma theileri TaxID=67003 RepID=A0A1X0P4P2_9TRYP|nr:uncharacterized protein TM35_000053970 [Trypanosoma theileri]ORC91801.1 hypothetical protein TM35_000053970 [Trypanosoma theileri]